MGMRWAFIEQGNTVTIAKQRSSNGIDRPRLKIGFAAPLILKKALS
jgi:hypothetical protein